MKKKVPFRKKRVFKRVESHLEEKLLERLKSLAFQIPENQSFGDFGSFTHPPTTLPAHLSAKRNHKPFLDRGNEMEIDVAWPDLKIGIEVHGGIYMKGRGGGHTSPEGLKRDYYKINLAQTYGWILLIFPPDYCTSPEKATSQQDSDWSVAARLIKAAFKIRGVKVVSL